MTPPFPLGFTEMPLEAIDLVLNEAKLFESQPTGLFGPKILGDYACRKITQPIASSIYMRVYKLEKVLPPSAVSGKMRVATDKDKAILIQWNRCFAIDAHVVEELNRAEADAERVINARSRYLWEIDGTPVSMAGFAGETPSGMRIGAVYTPPQFRGRGFASALVAGLSQKLLDEGKNFCFLFTDLSNPTSNSIYQKIGYKPVAEFARHVFQE